MDLTQKQFVRGCYDFYREAGLTPGDPNDGEWQQAHYPKPKKMGRRWVWLLKEHHAIQSVLQSEEVGHPAVWSWERKYFVGHWEYLRPVYEKWMSEKGRLAGLASVAALTPEQLSEKCRKAGSAPHGPLKEGHKRGSAPASDKQKEVARQTALAQHKKRCRCLKTGYVSTPFGLTHYQQVRGIDPENRVELTSEEAASYLPKSPEEAKAARRQRRRQRKQLDSN